MPRPVDVEVQHVSRCDNRGQAEEADRRQTIGRVLVGADVERILDTAASGGQ